MNKSHIIERAPLPHGGLSALALRAQAAGMSDEFRAEIDKTADMIAQAYERGEISGNELQSLIYDGVGNRKQRRAAFARFKAGRK